ncbi:OmpA family protein [Aliiglaciecola sp. CAU 1673]|uniref:OmpA family protein n=1 Tax=Aliiglaciecola sp. CAU 1673 TaxID=3032595 RepID=UPI0023D99C5B|nr:OmpA family protein [Aliiglaciecola sp. CAU 1673]MDF2180350.1 OmpA family protein [Aliiglaciecola sp. CAU 1673]
MKNLVLLMLLGWLWPSVANAEVNLLTLENGARVTSFSSEYGGWGAESMVPSLQQLAEPGIELENFVWCSADNAPFPHWVVIEFSEPKWVTTLVFSNALQEEAAYPGISARNVEVWAGLEDQEKLQRVASFALERNKSGQGVQILPQQLRFLKLVILDNYGHPVWTEMNAMAAFDDGTRPASLGELLGSNQIVQLYGLYFDFASATLRHESQPTLLELVTYLKAHPGQAIEIEGHTDSVGSEEVNLALSERRAAAVVSALVQLGISAQQLTSQGYGEQQPLADNDSPEGRAKNRRVSVRVVSQTL